MAEITARKSLSGRNVFTIEIKIEKTKTPKAKPVDETKLGFGHIFTDHMFVMEYDTGKGWHDARIVPYGDISISPAAMVLHYGQEIFEGMKAYRTRDTSRSEGPVSGGEKRQCGIRCGGNLSGGRFPACL